MNKPIYGKPMELRGAIRNLQDADRLQRVAYILRDWVELTDWLTEQDVPDKHEDDVWMSTVERVKWLIDVKKINTQ